MNQDPDLEPGELPEDRVTVRVFREDDQAAIIRIDRVLMGYPREDYYRSKLRSATADGVLQSSLVAEIDDRVVGFVLSSLFYGEFGQPEPVAVLDSIGVDPEYRGRHVGRALMRQLVMNLSALHVERIETQVSWQHLDLLQFLAGEGFEPAPRISLQRVL